MCRANGIIKEQKEKRKKKREEKRGEKSIEGVVDFRRLSEISRGGIANRTRVEWPNFTVEWREKEGGGGRGWGHSHG